MNLDKLNPGGYKHDRQTIKDKRTLHHPSSYIRRRAGLGNILETTAYRVLDMAAIVMAKVSDGVDVIRRKK